MDHIAMSFSIFGDQGKVNCYTNGTWTDNRTYDLAYYGDRPPDRVSILPQVLPYPYVYPVVSVDAERKEEKQPMRGLFEVFIVDPETETIIFNGCIVATDEGTARLKAALSPALDRDKVDDYDFIVRRLGDVRAKRQVREVRVVEK